MCVIRLVCVCVCSCSYVRLWHKYRAEAPSEFVNNFKQRNFRMPIVKQCFFCFFPNGKHFSLIQKPNKKTKRKRFFFWSILFWTRFHTIIWSCCVFVHAQNRLRTDPHISAEYSIETGNSYSLHAFLFLSTIKY